MTISSTQNVPAHTDIPQHIAVIMDGNGRWAKKRLMPRIMGHKKGLEMLEEMTANCSRMGVRYLTVFAFSTENWRRPLDEVNFLMSLFLQSLQKRVQKLHKNNLLLLTTVVAGIFCRQLIRPFVAVRQN